MRDFIQIIETMYNIGGLPSHAIADDNVPHVSDLDEDHHAYDPSPDTEYRPIKSGDTVRVFHGFRDFPHAVEVARFGLSGRTRAPRVYSYESDNNPYGLFVSLSINVAKEFVGAYGVSAIAEFNAAVSDLEAPVWPSGGYTVQGQMAQYFGRGPEGRAKRRAAGRHEEDRIAKDTNSPTYVTASDHKHLADLLTNSREHQALFVGHLDPHAIVAWHVRPAGRYSDPYERISPEEFLARYGETSLNRDSRADEKLFTPNEAFDGDAFIARLRDRFGGRQEEEFFRDFVRNAWQKIKQSHDKVATFREYFEYYLWPKQYIPALQWMRREF